MDLVTTLNLLLSVTDKLMDKLPDYEQSKREEFYKLKKAYNEELLKEVPYRDDNLIDNLRDELLLFISSFSKEISGQEIQTLH